MDFLDKLLSREHIICCGLESENISLCNLHSVLQLYSVPRVRIITRGQSNLTKSASRGAHSPVRGHPRGSKFVPLNSWGRGSY